MFKEQPEDLVVLCRECHEKEHGRKFTFGVTKKEKPRKQKSKKPKKTNTPPNHMNKNQVKVQKMRSALKGRDKELDKRYQKHRK